jgi:type II secretory pathway pseudopilin PulG
MMFFRKFIKSSFFLNNQGFSIIESLVGITLAALLLVAFTALISQTIKINRTNRNGVKAIMYLQELIEVAEDLEQSATTTIFENHTCNAPNICHPEVSGNNWTLTSGSQSLENMFTRSIIIGPVSRDINNNIEAIYDVAHDDPNTKIVTATISWNNGFQIHNQTLETYLYYYGQ